MPRKYQRSLTLSNEHTKGVSVVSFSHDGSFIATGGLDGKICWWRTEDGELLYVWTGDSAVLSLVWVPRRLDTLLCGLQDGNLVVVRVTMARYCLPYDVVRYLLLCFFCRTHFLSSGLGLIAIPSNVSLSMGTRLPLALIRNSKFGTGTPIVSQTFKF